MLKLNDKLKEQFKENCIDYNEGMTTLLILYFGLEHNNSAMNDKMITQLSVANLLGYDYEKQVYTFPVGLFEEEKKGTYDKNHPCLDPGFMRSFIDLFIKKNPRKRVSVTQLSEQMVKLVKDFPDVTQHELMEAAKLHLAEFDDIHCKQPNYFIHKQGEGYNCMAYIERVREGESAKSKDFNPFEDTL